MSRAGRDVPSHVAAADARPAVSASSAHESLLEAQRRVLEMIVRGEPLSEILAALCLIVESQAPDAVKSAILLVDDSGLHLGGGVGPSLPPAYHAALADVPIDATLGTCAAAAALREPVVTPAIADCARWRPLSHLPLALGLKAAWSMPIFSSHGSVLGTFGTYFTCPREPTVPERQLVAVLAQTAALAIERRNFDHAIRTSSWRDRFLAELATATQSLSAPEDIMRTAARMLAEYLDVDRCAYAEIENGEFVITGDFTCGVPSIVGRWPLAAFGPACEHAMQAGQPYVVEDALGDVRISSAHLPAYEATQIRAVICVPLHKDGIFSAAMAVHAAAPRRWTSEEIELVALVVSRCWESLERAAAGHALREQRARLDYAVRLSGIGFWYCDLPFAELAWDERVKEHFFLDSDRRISIDEFFAILHPDDRAPTQRAIENSISQRRPYDVVYRTQNRDRTQTKWIRALGGTTYDESGIAVRFDGVTVDVTNEKLDEAELARALDQLREQDRRKDEFLATLAHELRNPLAPIVTALEVLGRTSDAATAANMRAMLGRQVRHLVRLVDDLLDLSRVTLGKVRLERKRIDLREVLDSAIALSRPLLAANEHRFTVSIQDGPMPLDGDATRLAQVLANLLNNAAKYTPRGGRIELSARRESAQLVVEVSDNGIGIAAAWLPRVFDLFTQVAPGESASQSGLGIGLTLVKRLVQLHGGEVGVTSAGPGQGSTFCVRLPLG